MCIEKRTLRLYVGCQMANILIEMWEKEGAPIKAKSAELLLSVTGKEFNFEEPVAA